MELTEKHRNLIENIVRKNPRFNGNEDLLDDFCSETFKRFYSIASSFNDIKNQEVYLNKVASTAILEVLRSSGRLRKSKGGYKQIKENQGFPAITYELDEDELIVFDIPDPAPAVEEKIIQEEEIKEIRDIILKIDSRKKDKRYFDIFTLRYLKGLNQAEISSTLGISQGEVSKRITELAQKVNKYFK